MSKPRTLVPLMIVLALALRLGFWVGVMGLHKPLLADEISYNDHAANIADGRGLVNQRGTPTAVRPPLYPLVLSGLYKVFGPHKEVARSFGVVLGGLSVLLTYIVSRRFFSLHASLLAAGLVAVNPYLVFINSYVLTESLYIVLLLAFLAVMPIVTQAGTAVSRLSIGGGLLGLASLTRPNAVLVAGLVVAGLLLWSPGSGAKRVKSVAVFSLAAALTIAPWAVRNYYRLGHWIPLSTAGGMILYEANNQLVYDVKIYHGNVAPREDLPGWEYLKDAPEVEKDREARRLAVAFLKSNPRLVPKLVMRKMLRFWRLRSEAGMSGIKSGWWWDKNRLLGDLARRFDLGLVYAAAALPFFLVGIVLTARRFRKTYMLYSVIVAHVLGAAIYFGSLRARTPIEPLVAVLAAVGMTAVAARAGRRIRRC